MGSSRRGGGVEKDVCVRRIGFGGQGQQVVDAPWRRKRRCRAVKSRAELVGVFREGMPVKVTGDVIVFHAPGSSKTGLNVKVMGNFMHETTTYVCVCSLVWDSVCEEVHS